MRYSHENQLDQVQNLSNVNFSSDHGSQLKIKLGQLEMDKINQAIHGSNPLSTALDSTKQANGRPPNALSAAYYSNLSP